MEEGPQSHPRPNRTRTALPPRAPIASRSLFNPQKENDTLQTAAEGHTRASALDLCNRIDEVDAVRIVLRESGGDSQHVAIEDDILRVEIQLRAQQFAQGAVCHGY